MFKPLLPFALALTTVVQATTYTLTSNYSGTDFFSGWDFVAGIDGNTTGNVLYQSQADATSQKLAYVNNVGNAIIKVDNTTVGTGDTYGRASVKITSKVTVKEGSLILFDALHIPYGCSVWPAFWSQGVDWPNNGEIDIVENVNLATNNQYTLHTLDGCNNPGNSSAQTGAAVSTNCFNATNGNSGCAVKETQPNSYGASFASNGGGAYATLWNTDGITTWFFPRASIPSDFDGNSPDPSSWGTPSAYWPKSSCNPTKFFGPQTLIFDITLCGNFAGLASVFNEQCSGLCTDLIKTPTNYNDAYFEIKSVRTFSDGTNTASGSSSTATLNARLSFSTVRQIEISIALVWFILLHAL